MMRKLGAAAARTVLEESLCVLPNYASGGVSSQHKHRRRRVREHVLVVTDANPCAAVTHVTEGYRAYLDEKQIELQQQQQLQGCDHHGHGIAPQLGYDVITFDPETLMATIGSLVDKYNRPLSKTAACATAGTTCNSDELPEDVDDEEQQPPQFRAVVLIQRNAFQNSMKAYRLRLRLFEMGLRVAEHCHLGIFSHAASSLSECCHGGCEAQMKRYLRACAFSPTLAKTYGEQIKSEIDGASADAEVDGSASCDGSGSDGRTPAATVTIDCVGGHSLQFDGPMETCLLNTGYYSAAHEGSDVNKSENDTRKRSGAAIGVSIGGTFPVGEVITEAADLGRVNGTVPLFAYPNTQKKVTLCGPPRSSSATDADDDVKQTKKEEDEEEEEADELVTMEIREGKVVSLSQNAPSELMEVIELVRQVEGDAYIRELGIGLNPFVGKPRRLGTAGDGDGSSDDDGVGIVSDVTAFERQFGVHLSVGKRHPLFPKRKVGSDEAACACDGGSGLSRTSAMDDANNQVQEPRQKRKRRQIGPVIRRKEGKFHLDVFVDALRLRTLRGFVLDFTSDDALKQTASGEVH